MNKRLSLFYCIIYFLIALYEELLFILQVLCIGLYITHKTRKKEIYEEFWISRTPGYLEVFPRSLQLRDRGILLYLGSEIIYMEFY